MPVIMVATGWRVLPVLLCGSWGAAAPDAHAKPGRDTKPTLLRFASLKRHKTNVRVRPGTQYPIRWIYQQQGLPIEIVAEFSKWRRVRGSDSSDAWIHTALLSSKRTALAAPWSTSSVNLRARPIDRAAVIARLQPMVLVYVKRCDRTWCAADEPEHHRYGYSRQVKLWGVYPDETI